MPKTVAPLSDTQIKNARADIMQIITKLDDNNAGVAAHKCLSIARMVYKYALTHSKALHNIAADTTPQRHYAKESRKTSRLSRIQSYFWR